MFDGYYCIRHDLDVADTIYTLHPRALSVLYSDVERHASAQPEVFVGTPGSLLERENAGGFRFYARQWYDADGKKREDYVAGPIGAPAAEATVEALRARVRDISDLLPSLRMLGREGFQTAAPKAFAAIAALHNHGVFAAGGILVGSHAYGVVLNRLGVSAEAYATEDVGLARREALAFDPPPARSLVEMLNASGVQFAEVPGRDRKRPGTSFKQHGRSRFHVDLLAPSRNETYPVIAVPELRAHAVGLPYLGYLLAETQPGAVIARTGCCPVRVPLPERFAIHKLVISQLRTGREDKSNKDIHQATVLCAALAETHPGALESARIALPKRAKKHFDGILAKIGKTLQARAPRAWEELTA
jgi:hypothetical protein